MRSRAAGEVGVDMVGGSGVDTVGVLVAALIWAALAAALIWVGSVVALI